MGPGDDLLEVHCRRCGAEHTLRFGESLHDRTLTCTSCGQPVFWRSCPVCETGWVAQRPGEPCPECGADPSGHIPDPPASPAPRGRRSPWHRACPVCGTSFVLLLASAGGAYVCPHCKRTLEDASPLPAVLGRALLVPILGAALALGLDGLARALLGPVYGVVRPVWLVLLAVGFVAGGLAWITRAVRLRPWRP